MTARSQDDEDTRDLLLRLLPMSASLAGLSVGAVTLFRLTDKSVRLATFADDLLVICAALFLLSTYGNAEQVPRGAVSIALPHLLGLAQPQAEPHALLGQAG